MPFNIPVETAGKRGYRQAHAHHFPEPAHRAVAINAWQVRRMREPSSSVLAQDSCGTHAISLDD